LLTGYYEPLLDGAREPDARFRVPILRRPQDLVNLVAESQRGAVGSAFTHGRQTANGIVPYATREEIETGALANQGLEFLWLENEVDAFFLHIQGSGRVRLTGGSTIRITYDGKNGHPYTSIGRYLIDRGLFAADQMSLDKLRDWLRADRERGRKAMWQNKSFVFFRELDSSEAESALGVLEIPLSDGRSLAVDTGFHAIGTPVYVIAPSLKHAGGAQGFQRLMIAQDVGSAIRGPERGDIYFGSGGEAGKLAGITKHPGRFIVLLPVSGAGS
jgi:membrane-bound lytic murein transglycosylase A